MKKNIKIVDCTLRDGGYNNDWVFGATHIRSILGSLQKSNVDFIECGYLEDCEPSLDRTKYGTVEGAERDIAECMGLDCSGSSQFLLMANYGDYDFQNLSKASRDSLVTGIRFAFHKQDAEKALESAKQIIDKGYDLYVQPMVTKNYSDAELISLADQYSALDPKAFYIVDSFGNMEKDELKHFFLLLDDRLKKETILGYHAHNSMQLAYSNAVMLTETVKEKRELFVDASILGMGRGAGNLNTEIFADFLNRKYNKNYRISPLLSVIDNSLAAMKRETPWGYSVAYFLAAVFSCHPNYATFLFNKKTLPEEVIESILLSIPDDRKNKFDSEYAEALYEKKRLKTHLDSKDDVKLDSNQALIIASGPSVLDGAKSICNFKEQNMNSPVLSVNHITPLDLHVDYYFFSNQKRYNEHGSSVQSENLILTSNIIPLKRHENCIVFDVQSMNVYDEGVHENSSLLLMNWLISKGVKKLNIAGLDGFSEALSQNYSYKETDILSSSTGVKDANKTIEDGITFLGKKARINFITKSRFDNPKRIRRIIGVIPARYESSRFPGKPLVPILGIPMIKRVYDQVKKSKALERVIVATDDERIQNFCEEEGLEVFMTSSSCLTGTDRIAEVAAKLDYDFYINIQGDEPVISPEVIDQVIDAYKLFGNEYIAYNMYKRLDAAEAQRASIIKTLVNENDELVYMSRCPVPYSKSKNPPEFNKQVCVYGFTENALREYTKNGTKTRNEKHEDIELLRFIDMGHKVKMIPTEYDSIAVDEPGDIERVEVFLRSRNG